MKIIIIVLGIYFWFVSNDCTAQSKCPETNLYKTLFVGEKKDSMLFKLPLQFIITSDSIMARAGDKTKNNFLAFRILGKECFWNEDFTKGKTVYKTMLYNSILEGNKYPTITVDFTDQENRYIEVFYENGMTRIFSIEKGNQ